MNVFLFFLVVDHLTSKRCGIASIHRLYCTHCRIPHKFLLQNVKIKSIKSKLNVSFGVYRQNRRDSIFQDALNSLILSSSRFKTISLDFSHTVLFDFSSSWMMYICISVQVMWIEMCNLCEFLCFAELCSLQSTVNILKYLFTLEKERQKAEQYDWTIISVIFYIILFNNIIQEIKIIHKLKLSKLKSKK